MRLDKQEKGLPKSALPCSASYEKQTIQKMFPDSEADLTVFVDDLTEQMVRTQGVVASQRSVPSNYPFRYNMLRRWLLCGWWKREREPTLPG